MPPIAHEPLCLAHAASLDSQTNVRVEEDDAGCADRAPTNPREHVVEIGPPIPELPLDYLYPRPRTERTDAARFPKVLDHLGRQADLFAVDFQSTPRARALVEHLNDVVDLIPPRQFNQRTPLHEIAVVGIPLVSHRGEQVTPSGASGGDPNGPNRRT